MRAAATAGRVVAGRSDRGDGGVWAGRPGEPRVPGTDAEPGTDVDAAGDDLHVSLAGRGVAERELRDGAGSGADQGRRAGCGHKIADGGAGCDAPAESGAGWPIAACRAAAVRGADAVVPVVGTDGGGVDGAAVRSESVLHRGREGAAAHHLDAAARDSAGAGRRRRSRYVDRDLAGSATSNPLRRGAVAGRDYWEIEPEEG